MYITRFLEKELMKSLNKKEIIAVIGPRQCGKTTLLKHIFNKLENVLFIDFEDREILEMFTQDIKSFAEIYVKKYDYLFIDEFQYAKEGGKQLKYIYDHFNTKIFISGSSATELSIQSIKFLVGRIFVFNLYPFSFEEYLNYVDQKVFRIYLKGALSKPVIERINQHYDEFAIYGGYPRVVLSEDKEEKILVLRNIYNTYFLKEIKEILNLTKDYKLSKLIHALALQIGGTINYNELSSLTGFDYHDLLKHLNILQKTFICLESRPYFSNKRKEISKAPKIFFMDNGFRNMVLKNFQKISIRADPGQINENFIASELTKKDVTLKYWKTKAKAEVDFVLEKDEGILPIEVKSMLQKPKVTRSFMNFIGAYSPKSAIVFSRNIFKEKKYEDTRVLFCPLFFIAGIE